MIDSHAHIHDRAFDEDRAAMLERARAVGVRRIVTVGCDLADSERACDTAVEHGLHWSLGVHPHEAEDAPAHLAEAFDTLIARSPQRPVAIGETGLDFHYDHSPRDVQRRVFEAQLDYAREHDLPLIFHQREAFATFIEVLREKRFDGMRAVVHCFTGTPGEARVLVGEFGFMLGIGGVVTFKGADTLREAVRTVGFDHLILETDCPYLAPVPHRGKRNEPAFLDHTVTRLCELLVLDRSEFVKKTDDNVRKLFKL